MPLTINTNIGSLNAQRHLQLSQSTLSTSMQRLSSGLRINSAKDDAAGLAIAERMSTQVRAFNVAARNANDGISLAQTAEGALGKVGDMLQRMRELAVQSVNATNTQTDRDALNAEVTALKNEIGRVAAQTSFNGTKLIDGSFASQQFQVGANAGETITVGSIANVNLAALGTLQTGASGGFTATYTGNAPGVMHTLASGDLTINGIDIGAVPGNPLGPVEQGTDLRNAINAAGIAGVTATVNGATGAVTVNSTDPAGVVIGGAALNQAATEGGYGLMFGTTPATPVPGTSETGIANLTITTAEASAFAIAAVDTAISVVSSARASLGALQSRFENVVSNIQVTSENLSAARGRIVDADFAAETANLSRAQILQQAGTAMVAQANQLPQQVLQLLR